MKQKKRLYLLTLLVLVCLVLVVTGTYAAYTNTASVKRVVTTGTSSGTEPFSSNYLYKHSNESTYFHHIIKVPKEGSTRINLVIYNYPPMDSTRFSSSDILYNLNVEVVDKNGVVTGKTPPAINADAEPTGTGAYRLKGGKISINVFYIDFSSANVETFKNHRIRITAEPETPGLTPLAAEFELVSASATDARWKGHFVDTKSPENLDAFNYEVSGTAEGTVTISWEANHVTLSKWSREDLDRDSTGNSISFHVGGEGNPTSYLLQFYRLSAPVQGESTPNITCTFEP